MSKNYVQMVFCGGNSTRGYTPECPSWRPRHFVTIEGRRVLPVVVQSYATVVRNRQAEFLLRRPTSAVVPHTTFLAPGHTIQFECVYFTTGLTISIEVVQDRQDPIPISPTQG